jgi:hypothetical protein
VSEQNPAPGEIGRDGVMVVRVNGRSYPARHVAQCKTCRSKYRTQIERGIIGGMTYQSIIDDLVEPYDDHSPLGAPGYQSVMGHVRNGHMPMPYSLQRRILEKRASEMGKSVEQGESLIVDTVAATRMIVQRGFELMNNGDLQPSMGDLLKALQFQSSLEADKEQALDEEVWRDALIAYMDIVQRNVDPEVFQRIGREMARSPALQQIAMRRRGTVAGEIES